MNKDFRFTVISEGLKNGVTATCRKYNISRTLYYRWLERYKTKGIDGLKDIEKHFEPVNKTDSQTEDALLSLIKKYPDYGPRALKYLFDEQGYNISESAVYNIMIRNNLNKKKYRIEFANKQDVKDTNPGPNLSQICSGECWVFWIADYGYYENIGNIYEYTLYDLKSNIAGTRLYNKVSFQNFEELLTAVAMPIATTLNMKIAFLCFLEDNSIFKKLGRTFKSKINKLISDNGFDFSLHIISNSNEDINLIDTLKNEYTKGCLTFIMPLINDNATFSQIKVKFQDYVKNYNLHHEFIIDGELYAPAKYHNKLTDTKLILPIWAYINREY